MDQIDISKLAPRDGRFGAGAPKRHRWEAVGPRPIVFGQGGRCAPEGPKAAAPRFGRIEARAARALERGVTLVEVLIVVAIIAMVAGGVAVFALPRFKEAQVKTAETGARVIRSAVQSWQTSGETGCPTVAQLVQQKYLDSAANTNDPWNEEYSLTCDNDDVTVASKGPDKKAGTADDVRVPKGAAAAAQ